MVGFLVILLSLSACFARFFGNVTSSTRPDHDDHDNTMIKDYFVSRFFGSKRRLQEDSQSSASRIVRVDDFGAKGNGADDTNVRI